VRLCPWADVVYGCDAPWWKHRNGLPEFSGIKLAHATEVCTIYPGVNKIEIKDEDRILIEEPATIGSGGNSGFQALNIAVQFGARRILLVGFDLHGAKGLHWYGKNTWRNANNPYDGNFMRWRRGFASVGADVVKLGISVVNASPDSAMTVFPQMTIPEALERWGID
jgi:hypothetical protein